MQLYDPACRCDTGFGPRLCARAIACSTALAPDCDLVAFLRRIQAEACARMGKIDQEGEQFVHSGGDFRTIRNSPQGVAEHDLGMQRYSIVEIGKGIRQQIAKLDGLQIKRGVGGEFVERVHEPGQPLEIVQKNIDISALRNRYGVIQYQPRIAARGEKRSAQIVERARQPLLADLLQRLRFVDPRLESRFQGTYNSVR